MGSAWLPLVDSSGFGYAGAQNAVHMLGAALLVILPEPESFSVGKGSKHGVFPRALAVPTDLQSEQVFHCVCLVMNLR